MLRSMIRIDTTIISVRLSPFLAGSIDTHSACSSFGADREPEIYQGAPVSLQLVGRRYEDEKVRPRICGLLRRRRINTRIGCCGFRVYQGADRTSLRQVHLKHATMPLNCEISTKCCGGVFQSLPNSVHCHFVRSVSDNSSADLKRADEVAQEGASRNTIHDPRLCASCCYRRERIACRLLEKCGISASKSRFEDKQLRD